MINLQSAFNYIINLKGREMQLHDLESDTKVNIKIAKSNYIRDLQGLEETTIKGREFIISKKLLDETVFPALEKNHRIIDDNGDSFAITEVIEMEGMGDVLGYRVRVS